MPQSQKKVREKSSECHNHKPQPFTEPKRKRKPTNLNKHKPNKRTKSTKISSLFPKRGNRNTKRTVKHKNKMTHGKTYNKSPRRINYKATKSKTDKPQPFPDPKRKRKPTNLNKHKPQSQVKKYIELWCSYKSVHVSVFICAILYIFCTLLSCFGNFSTFRKSDFIGNLVFELKCVMLLL